MKVHLGHREKFPLISEINMIPLIDVALVLLIIFMVVTPFLVSSQIKVNLPKAVTGIPPDTEPVKIQITSRRTFYVDEQVVLAEDLPSLLRLKFSKVKEPTVLIEADASVPFEAVIQAMDSARASGAQKLGVGVKSNQKEKK